MYLHRQSSGWMLFVLVFPTVLCAAVAWMSHVWWLFLLAAALVFLAWTFSSLTIEVNEHELVSHFGPGLWRKHVPLNDIVSVECRRTSPMEGWGIHITTRGMLYNVSGLDAVEVQLATGRRFRLGTDDPDNLLTALRARLHPAPDK